MANRYIRIDWDSGSADLPTRETLLNKLNEVFNNIDVKITECIDQDYNSDSENAQSGKAVAKAISNKADKGTKLADYGIKDAVSDSDTLLLNCGNSQRS